MKTREYPPYDPSKSLQENLDMLDEVHAHNQHVIMQSMLTWKLVAIVVCIVYWFLWAYKEGVIP